MAVSEQGLAEPVVGEQQASQDRVPLLKAPRGLAWEFVLHFTTMGLYTMFWMVGRLRDIRRMGNAEVTPWLWFFVPLIALAQLVALPRLMDSVRELEARYHLLQWGGSRYGWMSGVVAITLFHTVHDHISLPTWTVIPTMLLWAALFSALEARLNRVRRASSGYRFRQHRYGYSWPEWLLLLLMLPVTWMYLIHGSLTGLGMNDTALMETDSTYEDPQGHFQFPVAGEGWAVVEPGTFSEDESVLELRGPIEGLFGIVFHYKNTTLDDLAAQRRSGYHSSLQGASCKEQRRLARSHLSVASHLVCTGRDLGQPALWSSGIIETDSGLYELTTYLSAPRFSYRRHEEVVLQMTKGFEPQ